jgi:hypothetical protein
MPIYPPRPRSRWTRENGTRVWTLAAPMGIVGDPNNIVWEPPDPSRVYMVRWPTFWRADSDPFVAAGGATSVKIGTVPIGMSSRLLIATALAAFASIVPVLNTPNGDQSAPAMYFFAPGALPGLPLRDGRMAASTDAGTVSGTLHYTFEWQYVT